MKWIAVCFLIAPVGCASGQSLQLPRGTEFAFQCDAESLKASVRLGPNDIACEPGYFSKQIAVTPGETYTFNAKLRTEHHGAFVSMLVSGRDANRSWLRNHFGRRQGTTRPDEWQEIAMHYRAESDEQYVNLKFYRDRYAVSNEGSVFVKDVAFHTGPHYTKPPTDKIPYETPTIRVDSDGQFSINGDPFFPIAIYASHHRDNYELYADQGFNTVMRDVWGPGYDWQKSHDAGLYHTLDVTRYIQRADSPANALQEREDLAGVIAQIKAHRFAGGKPAWPRFLCYYFDNENEGTDRDWATLVLLRKVMVGRPFYILQGNQGIARTYDGIADVTGTYVTEKGNYNNPGASAFRLLKEQPGLTTPVSWMQITEWPVNSLTAEDLRLRVYQGVIAGARAMGIWQDHWLVGEPDSLKIENRLWWGGLPALAAEIQAILPILISPNAPVPTTCSDPTVELLTKLKSDTLFVVAASPESTIVDLILPHGRRTLVGLFDGSTSTPDAVALPAGATRVWRVE